MPFQSRYSTDQREQALSRIETYADQEGERRHAITVISAEMGIPKSVLYYWVRQTQPPPPRAEPPLDTHAAARLLAEVLYCGLCEARMRCLAVRSARYYACCADCGRRNAIPVERVIDAVERAVATRRTGAIVPAIPAGRAGLAHIIPLLQRITIGRSLADVRLTWRP